MEVEVFVNDKVFKQFTSIEIYKSCLDFSQRVNLTYHNAVSFNGQQFDIIKPNDKIEIFIDGVKRFAGYLAPKDNQGGKDETKNVNDKQHDITVSLCDAFGFLETNRLSKSINHNTPIDIVQVISDVLTECGYKKLNDFQVKLLIQKDKNGNEINTRITSKDSVKSEVGIKAFDYLAKFLQKKQLLLYSNGIDTLNLSKSGIEVIENASLISNKNSDRQSNVLEMRESSGDQMAYGTFEVISVNDVKQLRGNKPSQVSSSNKHTVTLKNALPMRKMVVILRAPADKSMLRAIAETMAGNHKRRERVVTCRVPGYYANKENKTTFEVNELIFVDCDSPEINDYMLIQDVRHFYSPVNKQSETLLTLINKSGIDVSNIQEIERL